MELCSGEGVTCRGVDCQHLRFGGLVQCLDPATATQATQAPLDSSERPLPTGWPDLRITGASEPPEPQSWSTGNHSLPSSCPTPQAGWPPSLSSPWPPSPGSPAAPGQSRRKWTTMKTLILERTQARKFGRTQGKQKHQPMTTFDIVFTRK